MEKNSSIILILLIIIGLLLLVLNLTPLKIFKPDEVKVNNTNEYLFALKSNNTQINGILDIYEYSEEEIKNINGSLKSIEKTYTLNKSVILENKSYTTVRLDSNKTYCFKSRAKGYYSNKYCEFLDYSPIVIKKDVNLNKSSNISVMSNDTIEVGENSILINIINSDSLYYRNPIICVSWSNNFVYSRFYGLEEIKRLSYYYHCYLINTDLDKNNKIIALKLYYKTLSELKNDDYIEVFIADGDEGFSVYNDKIIYDYNNYDVGGLNKIYKFTKFGNY